MKRTVTVAKMRSSPGFALPRAVRVNTPRAVAEHVRVVYVHGEMMRADLG